VYALTQSRAAKRRPEILSANLILRSAADQDQTRGRFELGQYVNEVFRPLGYPQRTELTHQRAAAQRSSQQPAFVFRVGQDGDSAACWDLMHTLG
jgi:hypothetical protein